MVLWRPPVIWQLAASDGVNVSIQMSCQRVILIRSLLEWIYICTDVSFSVHVRLHFHLLMCLVGALRINRLV